MFDDKNTFTVKLIVMDRFNRLMQTHNMLRREFEELRSRMQKTLFYLDEFNRRATNEVEDCKRTIDSSPDGRKTTADNMFDLTWRGEHNNCNTNGAI